MAQVEHSFYSISLGVYSGYGNQGTGAVAVGYAAGQTNQDINAVALGWQAGNNSQATAAVALGSEAGKNYQGTHAIAIGSEAGKDNQSIHAIAIGSEAGYLDQTQFAIAIGSEAGRTHQSESAIALGNKAGLGFQGTHAIAIGTEAGRESQGTYSIALGYNAGKLNLGTSAISIGYGANSTYSGSIVLNTSNAGLEADGQDRFFVNPVRNANTLKVLYYNSQSSEVTWDTAGTNVRSGITQVNVACIAPSSSQSYSVTFATPLANNPSSVVITPKWVTPTYTDLVRYGDPRQLSMSLVSANANGFVCQVYNLSPYVNVVQGTCDVQYLAYDNI